MSYLSTEGFWDWLSVFSQASGGPPAPPEEPSGPSPEFITAEEALNRQQQAQDEQQNLTDLATQHGGVSTPPPLTPDQNASSILVSLNAKPLVSGVNNTTLLLVGGGAVLFFLLSRSKKR